MTRRSPRIKTVVASLVEHFGLAIAEVARLTDRQILEIYWHKRDKQGSILWPEDEVTAVAPEPEKPTTLARKLAQLEVVGRTLRIPETDLEKARAKLREKYGPPTE